MTLPKILGYGLTLFAFCLLFYLASDLIFTLIGYILRHLVALFTLIIIGYIFKKLLYPPVSSS